MPRDRRCGRVGLVRTTRAEGGHMTRVVRLADRRGTNDGPRRLWREAVGEVLRDARRARGERLADVAERAGVSPQYLSEVERGRKDASSEMTEAIAGAMDLPVADMARRAADILDPTLSGGGTVLLAA